MEVRNDLKRKLVARMIEMLEADLAVGQSVLFKCDGRQREGVITKVGRSRVTVDYQIASGPKDKRNRTKTVYARDIQV